MEVATLDPVQAAKFSEEFFSVIPTPAENAIVLASSCCSYILAY